MENPRWPPAAILDNILVLVTHHIYTIPTLPLPLRAQIFTGFALQDTVSEIWCQKWKIGLFWPFGPKFEALRAIQSNPPV